MRLVWLVYLGPEVVAVSGNRATADRGAALYSKRYPGISVDVQEVSLLEHPDDMGLWLDRRPGQWVIE